MLFEAPTGSPAEHPGRAPRALPVLARLWPGVFYGWWVAIGASLLAVVCVGIGFYLQSVLLEALSSDRGWDRTSIARASSLYFLVAALAGSAIGWLVDRVDVRLFLISGALLMAVGLVAVGRLTDPSGLLAAYGVMAVGFALCGQIPSNALVARWFVARRARAMTISQTGVSVGGVILIPLAAWLFATSGIEVGTEVLAMLLLGVVVPVSLLVLRDRPRAYGLEPDDGRAPLVANPLLEMTHQLRPLSVRAVVRSAPFWILAIAFGAILFGQVGVLVNQLVFVGDRVGPEWARVAVASTPAASIVGRIAIGSVADRLPKVGLVFGLAIVQASALVWLALSTSGFALVGASFLFGLTIGSMFMIQSLIVGEIFGLASFGMVSGLLALLTQTGSSAGPYAINVLGGWLGGLDHALLALAASVLVSATGLLALRAPRFSQVSGD